MAPMTCSGTADDELLRAEAELWCHAFGYLKSIALQSAIKLGIPTAIHRCGGAASLSELQQAALPIPIAASKLPFLSRLMRFLAASGIFVEETTPPADDGEGAAAGPCYRLTAESRLLVVLPDDDDAYIYASSSAAAHPPCLSQLILLAISPFHFRACQSLAKWLQKEEGPVPVEAEAETTPFTMAHGGRSLFGVVGGDEEFGPCFNEAMASDSRFIAEILGIRECRQVFAGVKSLVDVGGGVGTMARAIARAFPGIRCSVLELPQVTETAVPPADDDNTDTVEFVSGDMMEFIPAADAVLLKLILHNWSDEDCVRILKRAKEAVSTREPKGKVIIIDAVVGSSQSKQMLEAQLVTDLCMMLMTTGKERDMENWQRIFQDAGFTQYKILPIFGYRSLIELYP